MKNFIANLPLYLGALLQKGVNSLFDLSLKLHLTLNTEAGLKIKSIQDQLTKMAEAYNQLGAQAAGATVQRQQPQSKLANLIHGDGNGTKKPTDS